MKEYQSLSHTRWDCKYHVVSIPKRRKKRIFGAVRKHLGEMLHELAGLSMITTMEPFRDRVNGATSGSP